MGSFRKAVIFFHFETLAPVVVFQTYPPFISRFRFRVKPRRRRRCSSWAGVRSRWSLSPSSSPFRNATPRLFISSMKSIKPSTLHIGKSDVASKSIIDEALHFPSRARETRLQVAIALLLLGKEGDDTFPAKIFAHLINATNTFKLLTTTEWTSV